LGTKGADVLRTMSGGVVHRARRRRRGLKTGTRKARAQGGGKISPDYCGQGGKKWEATLYSRNTKDKGGKEKSKNSKTSNRGRKEGEKVNTRHRCYLSVGGEGINPEKRGPKKLPTEHKDKIQFLSASKGGMGGQERYNFRKVASDQRWGEEGTNKKFSPSGEKACQNRPGKSIHALTDGGSRRGGKVILEIHAEEKKSAGTDWKVSAKKSNERG